MIYCRTKGFEADEVYNWNVDEFAETYHALQRNEARDYLRNFTAMGQAFGGDSKSVKKFIESASAWLSSNERNGGAKNMDDFVALVRKGLHLKK